MWLISIYIKYRLREKFAVICQLLRPFKPRLTSFIHCCWRHSFKSQQQHRSRNFFQYSLSKDCVTPSRSHFHFKLFNTFIGFFLCVQSSFLFRTMLRETQKNNKIEMLLCNRFLFEISRAFSLSLSSKNSLIIAIHVHCKIIR